MSKKIIKKTPAKKAETFLDFLKEKSQKQSLLIISLFYLLAYLILIYLYPFPHATPDSPNYIQSAIQNKYLGYRPIGYSKFLILSHAFSTSTFFLVFFQYWLSAFSTVLFIYTIAYFFRPKTKIVEFIFFALAVCSVSMIFQANAVLSDSLFTSLTSLWMIFGIWFIYTPKTSRKAGFFLIHVILLAFLFAVRYTALINLAITVLIVFMTFISRQKIMALAFLILPLFFITVIYQNQVKATVKLTGVKTFSAFSGWLLANNAFHIYPFVKIDTGKISDPEVKQFVEYVLANDSMPVLDKYNTSTQFMWSPQFPLKKYLFAQMRERGGNYLNTFTYLGANVYNGFANYVILHYPVEFLRYFILPNFYGVLYPRLDDICSGFKGDVILKDQLQQWFDVDPQTNFLANSTIVEKMSGTVPLCRLVINILTIFAIIFVLIRNKAIKWIPSQKKIFWTLTFFVLSYLAFQVYAATCYIRYLMPLHLAQITIIYLALNNIRKSNSPNTLSSAAISEG